MSEAKSDMLCYYEALILLYIIIMMMRVEMNKNYIRNS